MTAYCRQLACLYPYLILNGSSGLYDLDTIGQHEPVSYFVDCPLIGTCLRPVLRCKFEHLAGMPQETGGVSHCWGG